MGGGFSHLSAHIWIGHQAGLADKIHVKDHPSWLKGNWQAPELNSWSLAPAGSFGARDRRLAGPPVAVFILPRQVISIWMSRIKIWFQGCVQISGEMCGKLLLCVSWGYSWAWLAHPLMKVPLLLCLGSAVSSLEGLHFPFLLGVTFWGLFCIPFDLGETTCRGKINGKTLLPTARKIFFPLQHENKEACQLSDLDRRGN